MPRHIYRLNVFQTPIQILENYGGFHGMSRKEANTQAQCRLEQVMLDDVAKRPVNKLSGGMKRRLMLARALMHAPPILILDEPTAGVDVEQRRVIWSLLQELNAQGTTMVLTTHHLEEAQHLCHTVAFIHHGRLIQHGPMQEAIASMEQETWTLELSEPLEHLPQACAHLTQLSPTQLQATLSQNEQGLSLWDCDSEAL